MIKNVTIGQYYPVDSPVHRLDPRAKFIGVIAYITALFISKGFLGYLAAFAALAAAVWFSKVPALYIAKGLKAVLFVVVFTAALNVFLTAGGGVIFEFYFIKVTYGGLTIALKMTCRLVLLVASSSVLTLTTTPTQLTAALEDLLKPLKKIKAPIHEIAMMMTIALRFIPTLIEEADKIMKAQAARGAEFDTGGLIKKAKALVPLLVPLFIGAIRRAEELATAMEARCYRGDIGRTKYKTMKYRAADFGFFGCVAALVAACACANKIM